MKQISIIETAEELIQLATGTCEGHELENSAKLVIENDFKFIQLAGTKKFELNSSITAPDLLRALLKNIDIDVHIT